MKEIKIIGKNYLSAEDIKGAQEFIEQDRKESREKFKRWEEKKSPEILAALKMINQYLNEELTELGLAKVKISADQIHFFSQKNFTKLFPEATKERQKSFCEPFNQSVIINRDAFNNKLLLFWALLHECIHLSAYEKYCLENKEKNKVVGIYRSGYHNINLRGETHFNLFNEAVTEAIVREILKKHSGEVIKLFQSPPEEIEEANNHHLDYEDYESLLYFLIEKIAQAKGISADEVWRKIKKGYFTGEMMHLREIEKVFGRGTLRLIASLGNKHLKDPETIDKLGRFFTATDPKIRQQAAKEIMPAGEHHKYLRRVFKEKHKM